MTRKRTSSFNLTFSAGVLFQRQPQVVVVISRPSSLLHSVTSSFYDPCPPDFWPLSLRRTLSQLHKLVVKFHETKRPLDMFSHISRNWVVSLEILEKNPSVQIESAPAFLRSRDFGFKISAFSKNSRGSAQLCHKASSYLAERR